MLETILDLETLNEIYYKHFVKPTKVVYVWNVYMLKNGEAYAKVEVLYPKGKVVLRTEKLKTNYNTIAELLGIDPPAVLDFLVRR